MKLFIVIPVAVFFGVTHGERTFAVLALEFIAVLTMAVYLHERAAELDPAKQPAGCRLDPAGSVTGLVVARDASSQWRLLVLDTRA